MKNAYEIPININQIIKSVLDPFGDPVSYLVFLTADTDRTAVRYYTFNYVTLGDDFADDAPGHERYLVQVHFVCPMTFNRLERIHATKRALFDAGFTWPEMTDASDENIQHAVLECEYAVLAPAGPWG